MNWKIPTPSPWFLVGNGGMDPYDSPLRSPIVVPITHSPIPYKNQSVDRYGEKSLNMGYNYGYPKQNPTYNL